MGRYAPLPKNHNMGAKAWKNKNKCAIVRYLSLCNVGLMPPTVDQEVGGSSPPSCTSGAVGIA